VRVAVVAIGDELLLGDVVNSNLARLGRALAAAGLDVVRGYEVGDGVEEIVDGLRSALRVADAVVVCGGLGPTSDDRTADALAVLAGPGAAPPLQLPNRVGSAAGLLVEVAGRPVCAVPGVPAELVAMVDAVVVPLLGERAGPRRPLLTRQLRVAVLGESEVARRLTAVEQAVPPDVRLAYLASPGEVLVRFTGRDAVVLADLAGRAADLLGDVVSGTDAETLPATVLRLLRAGGATVAVAESLTGGRVTAALVDIPGASTALVGGLVAYASAVKRDLLGVDAALLAEGGAVQPEVAAAMARGVRQRLGTTYGVATTGVAGPDPQDGQPPGSAHVAVAGPDGLLRVDSPALRGDRERIRTLAGVRALDLLRRVLLDRESADPPAG